MKVQIQKWGNSLALRIPKSFAVETDITNGSTVNLSVEDGNIVIASTKKPRYTLEELLEGLTEDQLHGEIDTGSPIGREVW